MPPKVVCIVGPTGCGKTGLGVALAERLGGEVISCDSMQLYRGMVIGTAAPTEAETRGVPHHMVGVIDPREDYSVARYAADAAECVDGILARGKLPILVGGTGLYLDALLRGHGYAPGTTGGETRRLLERRWDDEGGEVLFAELRSIDPESAAALHPNDKKRVIRALEVYRETGKTMSRHNADTRLVPPRYEPVYLGLAYADREEMKRIIDLRVDRMVAQGLFDEVRALVESGVPRTATAMQAIGYKECLGCLSGECTQDEAVAEIKLRSRQYAKRQLTWLRRNRDIHWFYRKNSRDLPAALQFSTEILTNLGVSRFYTDGTHKTAARIKRKGTSNMKKTANLQDIFLTKARKQGVPLTVFLVNGFQMRGSVTGFDSFTVVLLSEGRQQMIYKHAISTIAPLSPIDLHEADETGEE